MTFYHSIAVTSFLRRFCLMLVLSLAACDSSGDKSVKQLDASVVTPPTPKNSVETRIVTQVLPVIDIHIKDIIALNTHACLLSGEGEVYCWGSNVNGTLDQGALIPVDLGGVKALSISGQSGDIEYFDTGYHACARMEDNAIRCWGRINDSSVFDIESIFENIETKNTDTLIASALVRKDTLKALGDVNRLVTSHGVVCNIDVDNTLRCPHKHLAFLNGKAEVKAIVTGEVLTCIQTLEDEIECYDMRGEANKSPIFLNLGGESWPKKFDSRYVYSTGIVFLKSDGGVAYWEGAVPSGSQFPGVYGLESMNVPLAQSQKARDVFMSEYSTCTLLNDGSAKCWGRSVKSTSVYSVGAPETIIFTGRKIIDVALGVSQNCFLLDDNSVECFKL